MDKNRTSLSSSIDLSTIGGVADALSKGQKVVRGFLSSLSSQHHSGSQDQSVGKESPLPSVYKNSASLYPPSIFSPPSSAEEGEYAENLSPMASTQALVRSKASPIQPKTTPTNPEITSFSDVTVTTRCESIVKLI